MATGDLIYEAHGTKKEISPAKAAAYADLGIADGLWDGDRANMIRLTIERDPSSPTGFSGFVLGKKSVTPADIPEGVLVVGKEE